MQYSQDREMGNYFSSDFGRKQSGKNAIPILFYIKSLIYQHSELQVMGFNRDWFLDSLEKKRKKTPLLDSKSDLLFLF